MKTINNKKIMKTDEDFIQGIYEKAEILKKDEKAIAKIILLKPHKNVFVKTIAVAAAFMLVAASGIAYLNQPTMETPAEYAKDMPMAMRAMMAPDINMVMENSELILTAKVTKIEKSVYDEENSRIITNVKLRPTEILKGEFTAKSLIIKVGGGLDKENDSFEPYEAVFERSEEVLLFLVPENISGTSDNSSSDKISYILSNGELSKYSLQDNEAGEQGYTGNDMTVLISELKEIIAEAAN